jgi:FkbM family methyltransferase
VKKNPPPSESNLGPDLVALRIPHVDTGLELFIHDHRDLHVSKTLRETGIWEPYETQLLVDALRSGDVFLDVGANLGYYTVLAASLVGSEGKVFAFEPEPANFSLLESSCRHNELTNIELHCVALSDVDGSGYMFLNQSNLGDHQIYDDGGGRERIEIQLVPGDICLAVHASRADVIKIDTQGAEYNVLSGLQKLIKNSLPDLIMIVEFWPAGLRRAGGSGDQLLDLLLEYGLDIQIIDHLGHSLIPCTEADLRLWIHDVDNTPGNDGFLNLRLGRRL